jgi:hypothetical protein
MNELVVFTDRTQALVAALGERVSYRFFEFFTAQIRNPHTRCAYARDLPRRSVRQAATSLVSPGASGYGARYLNAAATAQVIRRTDSPSAGG